MTPEELDAKAASCDSEAATHLANYHRVSAAGIVYRQIAQQLRDDAAKAVTEAAKIVESAA